MKRKALLLVTLLALTAIFLPACENAPENIELNVHKALTTFRAHEDGVYDHHYEFEKTMKDGDLAAAITRYEMLAGNVMRERSWKTALTPLQSKALNVTGTLVHGDHLFLSGYHTLSMDGDLSDLAVNSRANGFLIQVDRETGNILGIAAIRSQTEAAKSTVIPLSIKLDGEDIILTGKSSGGIAVGNTQLEPKSAQDQFEIVIEPNSLEVLSASLTPLSSAPATFAAAQLPVVSKTAANVILDFLGNFEANAFASWAQSSILSALGFSDDTVQTELGQIDSQLNTINTQLNNIQSQLNTLLGDFVTLYNQELQNAIGSSDTLYTYFYNNMGTYFQGFRNAVNNAIPAGQTEQDLTMQMVASDTGTNGAVESFAAYFNGYGGTTAQVTMTDLITNLNNLFSTLYNTNSGTPSGLLVSLNQQAKAQLQQSNFGANSFDLVSTFDGYNESLMNVYSNVVQAIQMAYTIQSTFIYLAGADPSYFQGWVIPISGVESSQDYSTNQGALNTYYQTLFQKAYSDVAQYLISDSYDTVTAPAGVLGSQTAIIYQTGYTPMPAKTLSGMPPNNMGSFANATPWTQACNIYVWQGVSSNSFESGAYGSNLMTAQCNAGGAQESVNFALNSAASTSTGINFYYGPGVGGNNTAWLQPQQWSENYLTTYLDPTGFTEGYGYAQTATILGPSACIIISGQGWNPFPQANTVVPIANGGFTLTPGNYCTPESVDLNYTGWIIEEFISPLGLVSWFWIGAQSVFDGDPGSRLGIQVQCGGNDGLTPDLCRQGQGFIASNGAYVSYVCIGGYQVQLYSMGIDGTEVWVSIGDTVNCMN